MNVSGESRKETNDRKMEVLSAKTKYLFVYFLKINIISKLRPESVFGT